MKKILLILIVFPTLMFGQTCHKGNGLDYIKNFRIDGTDYIMGKKLESWALRATESDFKTKVDIYPYLDASTERNGKYSSEYSLCTYQKNLFLINLILTARDSIGKSNIQSLIQKIKQRLGQCNYKTEDGQPCWKFENYFGSIKVENSATVLTFIEMNSGSKFLTSYKNRKYISGY